jgi:NDP-sugar pyrophosphorylase family protein
MTPPFFQTYPRACAVILTSKGSRLFPMTTTDYPKHLLPVAGIPSILRLFESGSLSSFSQIIISVTSDDTKTVATLLGGESDENEKSQQDNTNQGVAKLIRTTDLSASANGGATQCWQLESNKVKGQKIYVIKLSGDCFGPIDALRQIEKTETIHPSTRIVVFPGDLVILNNKNVDMDPLIRPSSESACTVVLVDVLEQDEHGHVLKESAKVSFLVCRLY